MKRTFLLHLLNRYSPSPEEIPYKQEILEFVKNHPDCFERSLESGHITTSAWLLNKQGTHALLMHHAKLGIWVQLGGHADGNPNILESAIKEAKEESGISHIEPVHSEIFDIDIHKIPATPSSKEHFHYDIRFLLQVKSTESIQKNHESKELLWVDRQANHLPTNQRSILRMFEKWRSLRNLP